jgi:hypothetical protein
MMRARLWIAGGILALGLGAFLWHAWGNDWIAGIVSLAACLFACELVRPSPDDVAREAERHKRT